MRPPTPDSADLPNATSEATPLVVAQPVPLFDVVACDNGDASPLVVAGHAMGAEVRPHASVEAWFERLAPGVAKAEPADVAVLLASGERHASLRWIARACALAPETRVVAALTDFALEHVVAVVNQGARGLVTLPAVPERIQQGLRYIAEPAVRRQADRRAIARHRSALATLTPAEQDVLDGMLTGLANKQIAQRLSIGLRTVELRRSKIMRKMGARSLSQLISHVCAARDASLS